MTIRIKRQRSRDKTDQQESSIRFWDWFYLIFTMPFLLFVVSICFVGHMLAPLIVLPLWYLYLGYYTTGVAFYKDYIVIIRPLFFFKKIIPYSEISKIKTTKGKGTMIRVYLTDNINFWSFSPPSRKNIKKIELFFKAKGVDYQ